MLKIIWALSAVLFYTFAIILLAGCTNQHKDNTVYSYGFDSQQYNNYILDNIILTPDYSQCKIKILDDDRLEINVLFDNVAYNNDGTINSDIYPNNETSEDQIFKFYVYTWYINDFIFRGKLAKEYLINFVNQDFNSAQTSLTINHTDFSDMDISASIEVITATSDNSAYFKSQPSLMKCEL